MHSFQRFKEIFMQRINKVLFKGDSRSVKAKQNVLAAFFIKGADTLIYLLLVPLTLGYLNAYEYGIWLTLSSLLAWINSFDIGLGNGLRNKLAIAVAEEDLDKGRGYVSTTFYMLIIIVVVIFAVFSLLINYIDWYSLLNVSVNVVGNLKEIILFSFFFFCLNFIFKFVGNVYQALQLPAVNNLIGLGAHLVSLVIIYIMTKTIPGSLLWVAVVYSAAPPLMYVLLYPVTFWKLYPYLSPSYRCFRKVYLKDLFSLSALFFLMQIMAIVLFSLSNILISNLFGPDQVTPYNIAYKYFSFIPIFFGLLLAPIWSAATDAYAKNDLAWIQSSLRRIIRILLVVAGIIVIMVVCSGFVYHIWVGDEVKIPIMMSLMMGIYVFVLQYSMVFSSFLNGMGKLRLQTINTICVGILFCPICYFFAHSYGVIGVVIGMIVIHLSGALLNTIQLNKILNKTAKGIWLK